MRTLGIIGGGQLARMTHHAAARLGIETLVLDPGAECPAAGAGAHHLRGAVVDAAAIERLVRAADATTTELEDIDVRPLELLGASGHDIVPPPQVVAVLQNKLAQKERLAAAGLPTAEFAALPEPTPEAVRAFGLPAVQKAQRGGYDGRGVRTLLEDGDLADLLPVPSVLERYVERRAELGVMVVRDRAGEMRDYPAAEMCFAAEGHVLDFLVVPARIPADVAARAADLARRSVEVLGGVGVFGVELFLARDGGLLVNEIAPRTHNCGHYTIEACATSQFEQLVRILAGLPLGPTTLRRPAAMVNLLGAPGFVGRTVVEGLDEAQCQEDVHVHLYGKTLCWGRRKMGHITALADSPEAAVARARGARELMRVRGARRA